MHYQKSEINISLSSTVPHTLEYEKIQLSLQQFHTLWDLNEVIVSFTSWGPVQVWKIVKLGVFIPGERMNYPNTEKG